MTLLHSSHVGRGAVTATLNRDLLEDINTDTDAHDPKDQAYRTVEHRSVICKRTSVCVYSNACVDLGAASGCARVRVHLLSLILLVPEVSIFVSDAQVAPERAHMHRSCEASSVALPSVNPPEPLGGGESHTRTAGNVLKLAQTTPGPSSYVILRVPIISDNQPIVRHEAPIGEL